LRIPVPALNEHREDIPELTTHFLQQSGQADALAQLSICPEALAFFKAQAWPGNVRQLENAVQAAIDLASGRVIDLCHVQEAYGLDGDGQATPDPLGADLLLPLFERAVTGEVKNLRVAVHEQTDKTLFHLAYRKTNGNQAKMAALLNVTRTTVRQIIRKLGLAVTSRSHPSSSAHIDSNLPKSSVGF
jgi:DNA-binding NtrC family response regulator